MSKFGMSLFAGLMLLGAVACDDGVADTAQNAAICERVCKRVGECTSNNDTSACRKECVDRSEDEGFEDRAQDCSECVDKDDSCVQKALKCAPECAGVIAVSAST
jgi:hypothetical protein